MARRGVCCAALLLLVAIVADVGKGHAAGEGPAAGSPAGAERGTEPAAVGFTVVMNVYKRDRHVARNLGRFESCSRAKHVFVVWGDVGR